MKKIALFITLAGLMITGCSGFDCCMPSVLSASGVKSLDFTGSAGTQYIYLSSSTSWEIQNADKLPDWLDPYPLSGSTGATVQVDVTPNTDAPRCYTLVFRAVNGDKLAISVCQDGGDVYLTFLADDTPRWELGAAVTKNADTDYIFITDESAHLFGPVNNKYRTGRITKDDGAEFEVIEFTGTASVGVHTGATLWTHLGTTALYRCEILQVTAGKVWMTFKETAASQERRVVQ